VWTQKKTVSGHLELARDTNSVEYIAGNRLLIHALGIDVEGYYILTTADTIARKIEHLKNSTLRGFLQGQRVSRLLRITLRDYTQAK